MCELFQLELFRFLCIHPLFKIFLELSGRGWMLHKLIKRNNIVETLHLSITLTKILWRAWQEQLAVLHQQNNSQSPTLSLGLSSSYWIYYWWPAPPIPKQIRNSSPFSNPLEEYFFGCVSSYLLRKFRIGTKFFEIHLIFGIVDERRSWEMNGLEMK